MAKRSQLKVTPRVRTNRYFSESFKKKIVRDYEQNLITIAEISKEYKVTRTAIYKWIYAFSSHYKRGLRQVIEPMSDSKKIKELRDKIKELEQLVGRKQIEIEFKNKMIELAEELYNIDIKKKFGSKLSGGSGNIENESPGA